MEFPNLPYFIDGEFKLSETNAIHEYIADKWMPSLNGSTPQEKAQVAMIGAVVHEINFPGVTIPCYQNNKAAALKTIEEKVPLLVKFLGNKKFLVGDKPCWADFKLFESI